MSSKIKILIEAIIFLALGIVTYFYKDKENIINYISVLGSYASLLGILIAYKQIKSVKEISKITKQSVEDNVAEVNQYLSYSEISKTIQVVSEIENYIQVSRCESALIRMKDLKLALIEISSNFRVVKEESNLPMLKKNITVLGLDINNIYAYITEGVEVDFKVINQNLENIATVLAQLQSELKFRRL